jgi:hypothetical protein
MSDPIFERLPARSIMFASVTAANALSQSANESASPFSRSAFVILFAAEFCESSESRRAGRAAPSTAEQAPLLSSETWAMSRAHDRTSGVGCQVDLSSGNRAADLVMLPFRPLKMVCTSVTSEAGGCTAAAACCVAAGGCAGVAGGC